MHLLGKRVAPFLGALLAGLSLFSAVASAAGSPVVTANEASEISLSGATLSGTVNPNGATTTYKFEYGKTTSYTKSTTVTNVPGSGAVPVSNLVTGLEELTTYHYRISATNSFGTTVSGDHTFSTLTWWKNSGFKSGPLETWENWESNSSYFEEGFGVPAEITTTVGGLPVRITCTQTAPGSTPGTIGLETNFTLSGCQTYISEKLSKVCTIEGSVSVHLDRTLSTSKDIAFTFPNEECILNGTGGIKAGGFTIAAGPEAQHLSVTLTDRSTWVGTGKPATLSFSTVWTLNQFFKFGIR